MTQSFSDIFANSNAAIVKPLKPLTTNAPLI